MAAYVTMLTVHEIKATDRLWRTTAKFDKPNARRMDVRPPPRPSSPCVRGLLAPTYCISCRRIRLRAPRHCAEPSFCFTCVANNSKECYCSPLDYKDPTTPPPTSEPDGKFRLFHLPCELREEIYAYALDQRRAIRYQVLVRPRYQPPLTLASRQLREEALPIFFQVNEFKFDAWESGRTAAQWLCAMGDYNVRHLRNVVLQWPVAVKNKPPAVLNIHLLLGSHGGATWNPCDLSSSTIGYQFRSRQPIQVLEEMIAESEGGPWDVKSLLAILHELHNREISPEQIVSEG
nr:hypothetical protein B0A51_06408 [Rachicladosporium sp. CCFEE 5018]